MLACWHTPGPAGQSGHKRMAQSIPNRHWGPQPQGGGGPRRGSTPHKPCHPHLGLLQAVVDKPEVLAEEVLADGLPVDADSLTHLHQVRGAGGRGAEQVGAMVRHSTTSPPKPPNPPCPPVKASLQPVVAEYGLGEGTHRALRRQQR